MTTRVGIYLRISQDREGLGAAPERQLKDCTAFAEKNGWEVVDVFRDDGISAWNRRKKRPEFERLVTALSEGKIDIALAWKFDRLQRSLRDFARLKDAAEDGSIRLGGKVGRVYVRDMHGVETRTPAGRQTAGIMAAIAEAESENQSTRISRKERDRAEKGEVHTGGTRMFGYSPDRRTVVLEEAKLIREAARRIIAGESIRGVCADWERRGVKSVTGKVIVQHVLRGLLMRWALAGCREVDGSPVKGTWPAILKEQEVRRLRAILSDPRRMTRTTARRYLLTGLLTCGNGGCGELLVGRPRQDKVRRYVCNRQPGKKGCGKITRVAEPIEELVVAQVLQLLRGSDIRGRIAGDGDDSVALESIEQDELLLAELGDDLTERRITRAEYLSLRIKIRERIQEARRSVSVSQTPELVAPLLGGSYASQMKEWESRGIDWQRAVLRAVVDQIVVTPARRGYNRFDPSKVKITWKV